MSPVVELRNIMKLRLAFLWLLTALVGQGMAQTVSTIVRSTSPTSGPLEPYGVAADPDDNLYMTDPATQRIFRFRMSTGEYTVLAGKSGVADHVDGTLAQARFNDPHGIIYARGGLVVADSGNHSLRFIDLASGEVRQVRRRRSASTRYGSRGLWAMCPR